MDATFIFVNILRKHWLPGHLCHPALCQWGECRSDVCHLQSLLTIVLQVHSEHFLQWLSQISYRDFRYSTRWWSQEMEAILARNHHGGG